MWVLNISDRQPNQNTFQAVTSIQKQQYERLAVKIILNDWIRFNTCENTRISGPFGPLILALSGLNRVFAQYVYLYVNRALMFWFCS